MLKQSFEAALASRGFKQLPGMQAYDIRITIHQLRGEQVTRSEASADFLLEVLDPANQSVTYSDRVNVRQAQDVTAASFMFGAMATVDLRQLMEQAQNEAIDQLLDKPGFRAAVQPRGALRS